MTQKTKEAYTHLFKYIEENVCSLQCSSFMSDFELAMRNAIAEVWPNADYTTCWFHLCQACERQVAKNNALLKLLRSKNKEAIVIYKKILALALLPADEIVGAFEKLATEAMSKFPTQFRPFLSYYRKQWIQKVFKTYFYYCVTNMNYLYIKR